MGIKVVFVCLGNICRSPMAEAIFAHKVKEAGLSDQIEVDSCGTSRWHVGERPHPGTRRVLAAHNIRYTHRARQLNRADLEEADYLIAMDSHNLDDIRRVSRAGAETGLLLDYAPDVTMSDVPDPYYVGNFEDVYRLVEAGCEGLLEHIRREEGL
jgi:protein-tyrosine phosphatase